MKAVLARRGARHPVSVSAGTHCPPAGPQHVRLNHERADPVQSRSAVPVVLADVEVGAPAGGGRHGDGALGHVQPGAAELRQAARRVRRRQGRVRAGVAHTGRPARARRRRRRRQVLRRTRRSLLRRRGGPHRRRRCAPRWPMSGSTRRGWTRPWPTSPRGPRSSTSTRSSPARPARSACRRSASTAGVVRRSSVRWSPTRPPTTPRPTALWEHVTWLVRYENFSELKRDRTVMPDLARVRTMLAPRRALPKLRSSRGRRTWSGVVRACVATQ